MTRGRKLVICMMPALIGLCIIFLLGGTLSKSVYHNELTKYGSPICSMDRHRFEGETCEACGKSIQTNGVFFSSEEAMLHPNSNTYQLPFSDYYESYEEFKADQQVCLTNSIMVVVMVVMIIASYVVMHIYSKRGSDRRLSK